MTSLDFFLTLAASLAGFGAGLVSGLIVQYRRHVKPDGTVHYRPTLELTAKRIDLLLAVGVVLVMVSTVVVSTYNNNRQAECNAVLRELVETREFSSETSRDANTELIEGLIVNRPDDADARYTDRVINRYRERQAAIDDYIRTHPEPEPVKGCGI